MAPLIGNTAKVAFAKDPGRASNAYSIYPAITQATLGSDDLLPLLSEGVENVPTRLESKAFVGDAFENNSEISKINVGGSVKTEAYYEGAIPELILCTMGFENVNPAAYGGSPASLGGGAYRHIIELDQFIGRQGFLAGEEVRADAGIYAGDHKVRSGALGIDKTVVVERIRSAMINQMTVNVAPESIDFDFDMVGYSRTPADPGGFNAGNWTLPSVIKRALFTNMEVKLGTLTTGLGFDFQALTKVNQLSIVLNNNLKKDDQTTGQTFYIEEPLRNDFGAIEVSFKLARHETRLMLDRLDADSTMYMMMTFTGSQIGTSGFYYTHRFYLPAMKFVTAKDSLSGAGIIAPDYKLKAYKPAAFPNYGLGFASGYIYTTKLLKGTQLTITPTTYTGSAMIAEIINTKSSNYLSYF